MPKLRVLARLIRLLLVLAQGMLKIGRAHV